MNKAVPLNVSTVVLTLIQSGKKIYNKEHMHSILMHFDEDNLR